MAVETLPRWSLERLFPGLDSPEYASAVEAGLGQLDDLGAVMEQRRIGKTDGLAVTPEVVRTCEDLLSRINDLSEHLRRITVFPNLLSSTDTRNEPAKARLSEVQMKTVRFGMLQKRFAAWIGSLDVEALIVASPVAQAHAYPLRHMHEAARHLMGQPEEDLASELHLSAGRAWYEMWRAVSSQTQVEVVIRGERQSLPMAQARRLATNPDPEVRRAAYEGEMAAWKAQEVPCAATLNGIKGETLTLARRRGWSDPLDTALFNNHMDRVTLDAMAEAVVEAFPAYRRYFKAKAGLVGKDRLSWHDLLAPVGEAVPDLSWDDAREMILREFGTYSDKMRGLAAQAFEEWWIDAAPGPAKVDGAFCSGILPGESRVLMTFEPSLNSASTLAHELGHAYHNLTLADRTPIQRQTPSILAETASTFCESIVSQAAQAAAPPAARLRLIEAELQRDTGIVVDCFARFTFEREVFARRAARDLAPAEFSELMARSQRDAYGDGLDDRLHPYLWAAKLHFYGWSYYNFPYIFGLLFGLGLYARYLDDPAGFRGAYDDLLSSTGLADAASLASRFGVDVRAPAFWRSSLDVVRNRIDAFVRLAESAWSA